MKKQLGKPGHRKMYNTETARKLSRSTGGRKKTSYTEILFQTPKGDYFLAGNGGVLTRWEGKPGIVEMTPEAAKFWAKKNGTKL